MSCPYTDALQHGNVTLFSWRPQHELEKLPQSQQKKLWRRHNKPTILPTCSPLPYAMLLCYNMHIIRPPLKKIMSKLRQKVLVLYLANSALDSKVVSWSMYDGTGKQRYVTGDEDLPPYETGLDALKDGWRVIQFPQLIPPYPNMEYTTSFLMYEFIFEKLEENDG